MLKFNTVFRNIGRLVLYGVVFSSISYLSTLIFGDRLSYHAPIAEADIPYVDPGCTSCDGSSCDGSCGCGCDDCTP